jgi:hypothetical protein
MDEENEKMARIASEVTKARRNFIEKSKPAV